MPKTPALEATNEELSDWYYKELTERERTFLYEIVGMQSLRKDIILRVLNQHPQLDVSVEEIVGRANKLVEAILAK